MGQLLSLLMIAIKEKTYFSKVIFSKVCKIVRPGYTSERERICRFLFRFETISGLEYLEEVEQSQVV